jgi:hypothetical protein
MWRLKPLPPKEKSEEGVHRGNIARLGRDSSLRDPAHKKRAQEKAGSLRSE